ncbi:hypothetical protein HELRODRAFT_162343 [Helobdella robusta]|uniref:Uncharacterized protein n=1 Tax=Helobdella robusta TaxID=6412 RepID=T1ESJ1_HELRO|nr:hypothetical protein HELRODRAFT_162343 [Helobdella robusta]ESN98880.1 hypothetical protein HELRODRAFT_162343 [Helobdella robusta]
MNSFRRNTICLERPNTLPTQKHGLSKFLMGKNVSKKIINSNNESNATSNNDIKDDKKVIKSILKRPPPPSIEATKSNLNRSTSISFPDVRDEDNQQKDIVKLVDLVESFQQNDLPSAKPPYSFLVTVVPMDQEFTMDSWRRMRHNSVFESFQGISVSSIHFQIILLDTTVSLKVFREFQ